MELINVHEIEKRIGEYQREIDRLNQLLELSSSFDGKKPRIAKAAGPAKKTGAGRPRKGKRGAVTTSIIEVVGSSSKPITAGDVRDLLIEKGVVKKGSTTVATMLFQLARKGALKKAKSPNGVVYSMDSGKKAS
jgi:hypothetical protein